jgi:hypothetical protein
VNVVSFVRGERVPFLSGVVFALGLGCTSAAPPAPIPDPGGPFHTSVPPQTSLDALTGAQFQELCGEVSAAQQAYLLTGINSEISCREVSLEDAVLLGADGSARTSPPQDGGVDGGAFLAACQADYRRCEQQSMQDLAPCGLIIYGCRETVELLSACLNEIANTNPIAACVKIPTCAEAAAAGTTRWDAGAIGCPQVDGGPSLPACARLQRECPGVLGSNNPWY